MKRRIYFSCGLDERELPVVHTIRQFIVSSGAEVDFAPYPIEYARMEQAIEQCNAFLAVFAATSSVATWLIHAAIYAFAHNQHRLAPRPRLFGLCVDPWPVPKAYEHIAFEWLAEGTYENLLHDSPPR
jgi:hypothetical protein